MAKTLVKRVTEGVITAVCIPYMYLKYWNGSSAIRSTLEEAGVKQASDRVRRFTRIAEIEENLAALKSRPLDNLTYAEKVWLRNLEEAKEQANTPYPFDVYRLHGADVSIEAFKDYIEAWKLRGYQKNFAKPMRRVKLNYYADNAPPAYREQQVSLATAIEAENNDVEYPLPATDWVADSSLNDGRTHTQRTADKYIKANS